MSETASCNARGPLAESRPQGAARDTPAKRLTYPAVSDAIGRTAGPAFWDTGQAARVSIRRFGTRSAAWAAGSSRPLGQAVSVGVADGLSSITDTGLREEVVDVSFDG